MRDLVRHAAEQKALGAGHSLVADNDQVGVLLFGHVEDRISGVALARAAVLVLPSYSENFGNVVLEAMALGVPVMVTPEVGLAPVVGKSASGLVVQGDPPLLGAALVRLMKDEALRRELGANGRVAAQAFSWASVAQRMEREYLSLTGAPR